MEITTGLLAGSLVLLGVALWRLVQERKDCLLKSRVIAATGCGLVVTDATEHRHPVIYVNPAFRLLTGYTDEDILGQSLGILNGPKTDRGVIEKVAMAMQDGRAFRMTARHYRKNGSSFWNELTLAPIKNRAGRVIEYIWVMSDATLRHQAEEALKAASDLAPLPDLLSDAIIVVRNSSIVYANPAALTLLALSNLEDAVGKTIQSFLDPEIFNFIRRCAEDPSAHDSVTSTRGELFTQNGGSTHISLSIAPMVWKGKASLLLLVAPVTSRSKTEEVGKHRPVATNVGSQVMPYFGSWDRDIRTGIEIWSDEQCRIFGHEPGTILPTYDMFKAALHEEDRDQVVDSVERSLHEDAPFDVECRIVQPSGALRFIRCRGRVIRNATGEPIRMSGTVEDRTSFKLIEDVAMERDREFKVALESVPSGFVMVGQDDVISMVNTRAEQMFGYSREELLGRPIDVLLPGQSGLESAKEPNQLTNTEGSSTAGCANNRFGRRKDGSWFPIEIGVTPSDLTSSRSIFITIVDLTDRLHLEEAMQQEHVRLTLAIQAAHVGIFEHDHRTERLSWSPELREIFGVNQDEVASLQRYVEFIPSEERERILGALAVAHDPSGKGEYEVVHHLIRPDGTVRCICVRSLTTFEGEGPRRTAVRTIGAVVDMTDHEQVMQHLRNASRMEAIGTLAGGIAHELNNRLTAVLGFGDLALPLVPSDSKARRHIQQVVAAGRKSRELVHQLLTFSRPSDHVRRPLSLHLLVKESLKLLRPTIPSWIELHERIASSTRPISADMTQMHQMIFNLVENALQSMSKTGGHLDIRLQDRELPTDQATPAGTLKAGYHVCLTVRDSGEGMDPDLATHLFDPFLTTNQPDKGLAMGLAVVHDIVTAHGGKILVESEIGLGTTVSVYFAALPPKAATTPAPDEELPRGHECVLFVDDEETLARCGGEMLESLGYYPVVRKTAVEALEAFRIAPQRFDLLLTDQTMPGMNGEMLARECRKLRPELPIILCTGSDSRRPADDNHNKGFDELVLKPLTLHDLAHTIRRALDRPVSTPAPVAVPVSPHPKTVPSQIEESDAISARR